MASDTGLDVFKHLHKDLLKVLKKTGIKKPTPAQAAAILPILKGVSTLVIAPTGIGKTEAALLPILDKVIRDNKRKGITVLYVTPLRALNRDMLRRLSTWGEALGLDIAVRHGDTPQKERNRQSKKAPDVLITTPETLQILFTGKRLVTHLENVRFVVVDEIHELASDERGAQLSVALERLEEVSKHHIQRVGLSATVGNPKEVGQFLAGVGRKFKAVQVPMEKKAQVDLLVPTMDKGDVDLGEALGVDPSLGAAIRLCKELIEENVSTLLFVNTRDNAEAFGALFSRWHPDFPITVHHGSLSKEARVESEEGFKTGKLKALIATSSLELGIDVGLTDFILHYNSPRGVSRLVQRVGRSGHTFKGQPRGTVVAQNPDEILEARVIIDHMLDGRIEDITIRPNPLNVLANQILAGAMAKTGDEDTGEIFEVVKRAYPFRDLDKDTFNGVVEYLRSIRTLWLDEKVVRKGRKTMNYFYSNISMIPDEKRYRVVDITTRKSVAMLDESFVISLNPYSKFIVKGRSWLLIEVRTEDVLVQPTEDLGSLPSWVGEDIPVPFEVAMDVGKLRKNPPADLPESACDYLTRQLKESVMPTDRVVTVERTMEFIVVNACFGSRVNETIGRYLSAMLASKVGSLVGLTTDPYRIMIEMPKTPRFEEIRMLLTTMDPSNLENLIKIVIKNSSYLKWEIVNVGKKFGAIRKDLDIREINFDRLIQSLMDTIVMREAIDKVVWEDMDIENTQKVLWDMRNGDIEIVEAKISPIGLAGLESRRELLFPKKADRTVLLALKRRLEETDVRLACISCGANRRATVGRLPEDLRCHRCESVLVAALHRGDKDSLDLIHKRDRIPRGKKKAFNRLKTNADLVHEHRKRAIMALMARGVGPTNAGRILARQYKAFADPAEWENIPGACSSIAAPDAEELEFLRDILEAEVNYARTKRFWD
jgi:ATP-dependent Lhr-like helicase